MPDSRKAPDAVASSTVLGQEIETLAAAWLETLGYRLIARNVRLRVGEIDLVLRAPGRMRIVFAEVRFRRHVGFGGALGSVDARKRRRLLAAIALWTARHGYADAAMRIDVIGVSPLACRGKSESRMSEAADEPASRGKDPDRDVHVFRGLRIEWIRGAIEAG